MTVARGLGGKSQGTISHLQGPPREGIRVDSIVGIALTPDDGGYYMAGADRHVYGFGNAKVQPSPPGLSSHLPVAAIAGA